MTQQEREQAARAIFKVYEEAEAKLSKIASKAREHVRKVDAAVEDDEKDFRIQDAANVYLYLEKIEGAKRVASQTIKLCNRARMDGIKEDFDYIESHLSYLIAKAEVDLENLESWLPRCS